MQSSGALLYRRDAMNAEEDGSQPRVDLPLKSGWFECPLPRLVLCTTMVEFVLKLRAKGEKCRSADILVRQFLARRLADKNVRAPVLLCFTRNLRTGSTIAVQRGMTDSGSYGQASIRAWAAALVVVTMVAMVALPPLIDRDYLVLGNGLGERPIPLAAVLDVHALEEGTAKPVDQEEGQGNP